MKKKSSEKILNNYVQIRRVKKRSVDVHRKKLSTGAHTESVLNKLSK